MAKKVSIKWLIFFLLLVSITARAQDDVSYSRSQPKMIKGLVLNKNTKLPVTSAKIKVINTDSNITRTIRTDEKGVYFIEPRGLRNFILQIEKFGFDAYTSGSLNTSSIIERNKYLIDDILLAPNISYPPPRDTVKRPPTEYLVRKFDSLDILATSSAYRLLYDLNPGLEKMDLVDPNYKIVLPRTPPIPAEMKKEFSNSFKRDLKEDRGLQAVLKDTISFYNNLCNEFNYVTAIRYVNTNIDSARHAISLLNDDLKSFLATKLRDVRAGKAEEAIKLINALNTLLSAVIKKQEFSKQDAFYLKYIGLQTSLILFLENSRHYFTDTEKSEIRSTGKRNFNNGLIILASYNESTNDMDLPVGNPDLRSLNITIHLSKNGTVISDGPDVMGRFMVVCYPPALKTIESTHKRCSTPASFSTISVSNAPYEFMIYDLRNPGKLMKFVKTNTEAEIISTEDAFNELARTLLGVNQKGLIFYIKEN